MKLSNCFRKAITNTLLPILLLCLFLVIISGQLKSVAQEHPSETGSSIGEHTDTIIVNMKKRSDEKDYTTLGEYDVPHLQSILEQFIMQKNGLYGVYFKGLTSLESFGINETEEFFAASTIKVPLNLMVYSQMDRGLLSPDKVLEYKVEFYEGGSGKIQYDEPGTLYTIRELTRLSIVVSDNIATNMLLELVGREAFKDYLRQLGGLVVDDQYNISCPKDMALYLGEIFCFYQDSPVFGAELMNNFENTVFNERLPKYLPKNIKVAHKIGNLYNSNHDVGIIFADKETYILCVMSKDTTKQEAYETIAEISKVVYNYVEGP